MLRRLVLLLALAPAALAQSQRVVDGPLLWLNDMPNLAVAMVALPMPDPMLSVNARLKDDEEMQIAAQIGTLASLRRMMIDRSGIKELSRMPAPMRDLAIGYLRAEYALGLRFEQILPARGGFFSKLCANPNLQHRQVFRQTMEQCAAEYFGRQVDSFDVAYVAHAKSFPKMFGEAKGLELIEMTRQHAMKSPVVESPGTTLLLPYAARYKATPGCATWGGDTDGDSLCDFWELLGVPAADGRLVPLEDVFDDNGDGRLSASERPDALRKDVYVEVDWFADDEPYREAIENVVAVFSQAPVRNPDRALPRLEAGGPVGIRLHVAFDEELEPATTPKWVKIDPTLRSLDLTANCQTDYAHFDSIKRCHFGTAHSRTLPNAAAIRQARINVYRYALYVNEVVETVDGITPAMAEIGGNDMMFATGDVGAIGPWKVLADTITLPGCGPRCLQLHASTFMHELGHLLGLRHGGGDDAACKPNYLGVMNYHEGYSGVLDYSRAALPTLNECALDESAGLRGQWSAQDPRWPAALSTLRGRTIAWGGAQATRLQRAAADSFPIDWNGDGKLTPGLIAVDVDLLKPVQNGKDLWFLGELCKSSAEGLHILPGHDDWSSLKFDFRGSRHFAEGTIWHEHPIDDVAPARCPAR